MRPNTYENVKALFADNGGIMSTRQVLDAGVHPETLYRMRDLGLIEKIARGWYRLPGLPPLAAPDLVEVALRIPAGVICLVSALAFHNLTSQIPYMVHVAAPRGRKVPKIDYPPVRVFWFSDATYNVGFERHVLDGVKVLIYGPAKTIADCFKFRNRIGLDVAVEGLKLYLKSSTPKVGELIHYSKLCRVYNFMKPYLETFLEEQ
jgi:predicted transcriptional regulator of viral defense system